MSKTITIKLTKASPKAGPFTIYDELGNVIAYDVQRSILIRGLGITVTDDTNILTIESKGICNIKKSFKVGTVTPEDMTIPFKEVKTGCLWRHLTNIENVYNNYYGVIYPYIIEYPFAYQFQDQILQNVKDYTKVFQYHTDHTGVFSYNDKIELDNVWFNKTIVYNNQQSSGILNLIPKPKNNLKGYMSYPIFNNDSKTIIYTKSDNFYNFNCFWNVVKDKKYPLFLTTCESLSLDKEVNQRNMDYGKRSFHKEPLRAKELKVRLILDSRSDVNLVSQFLITPSQISYK